MHNNKAIKTIGMSKYRMYELRYFCMQYGQWQHKLRSKAPDSEKAEAARKLRIVDEAVFEAGQGIAPYLLEAVTHEDISFHYLAGKGMPCGRNYFYECRRKFFLLLDKKRGTQ